MLRRDCLVPSAGDRLSMASNDCFCCNLPESLIADTLGLDAADVSARLVERLNSFLPGLNGLNVKKVHQEEREVDKVDR